MKATLVLQPDHAPERRFRLEPRSRPGGEPAGFKVRPATVLKLLDGEVFKDLRDFLGARIETDDVQSAAEVLHLGDDRAGLVPVS
jgi:hypothetical protein